MTSLFSLSLILSVSLYLYLRLYLLSSTFLSYCDDKEIAPELKKLKRLLESDKPLLCNQTTFYHGVLFRLGISFDRVPEEPYDVWFEPKGKVNSTLRTSQSRVALRRREPPRTEFINTLYAVGLDTHTQQEYQKRVEKSA